THPFKEKMGTVGHRPAYSAGETGSMQFTPVLVFHICVGAMGLLSGATAMSFRKGSRRHRVSGKHICHFTAGLRGKRGVSRVHKTPNAEQPNGRSNFLSGGNGVVDCQASRWRSGQF